MKRPPVQARASAREQKREQKVAARPSAREQQREPDIAGAPAQEHLRSRAAQRVARLARRSGLFFSHYEQRAQLPLPATWLSEGATPEPTRFAGGVLAEPKYQAFRHDLLVASFHPSHRAQWTAHALCHALVGFAYKPSATMLFHALAAWLAELLPVALWYFLDEADLTRCPRHHHEGPLFQTYCEACERTALIGPRAPDRETARKLRDGRRYVKRELAAIARSRRLGRVEGTRFATIDLAEDALQYASAHGARLRAPEMARLCAQFFTPRQGLHGSLEALEARVIAALDALTGRGTLPPWRATRWDWAAQDVGYRLLSVRARQTGSLCAALDALIDALAAARTERGLIACARGYEALHAETRGARRARATLPTPERLFAVGYALPGGYGKDLGQLRDGIASACPGTLQALGKEAALCVSAFAASDEAERTALGKRFARFLARTRPGPVAELCALEAAITHVPVRAAWADCLDPFEARGSALMLAPALEIVSVEHDVMGATPGRVKKAKRLPEPRGLVILRRSGQPVDVLELPAALARLFQASAPGAAVPEDLFASDPALRDELLAAGVLVPAAYAD
jgi:hypothetical protein